MSRHSKRRSLTVRTSLQVGSMTLCMLVPFAPLRAQIIHDNSLGAESSIVTPNVNIKDIPSDQIDGGAIRGANLFHSFQEFNIGEGRGAYFTNPSGIENILSRVTGTNPSNILGTLGVLGNAKLFLINPNGIVFGSNAKLDMGGSFVASTASAIKFADGLLFSATNHSDSPLLSIDIPIGLQYRDNAGSIRVQGSSLSVSDGETLALVGGPLNLENTSLRIPGGRVELGGLAGQGTVGLNLDGNHLHLSFPDNVPRADVSFDKRTNVNVRAGGSGSIAINAQNVNIARKSRLQAGMNSGLDTDTNQSQGQPIEINATGAINLTDDSFISNFVAAGAIANGGDINITAGSLSITKGAFVAASTFGQGNAGNVNIHVGNTVFIDGVSSNNTLLCQQECSSGVYSRVESTGMGNGGNINITTGSLSVTNGARLGTSTLGNGDAGNVNIHARSTVSFDGVGRNGYSSGAASTVASGAMGNGRNVNITAESLSVTNGAVVGASTSGQGNGGNITLNINNLEVLDGGQVLTTSFSNYKAGNITIDATRGITLAGSNPTNVARRNQFGPDTVLNVGPASGLYANTYERSSGEGGNVTVNTPALIVRDGAQVSASNQGSGNAGNIAVKANSIRLDENASISAETASLRSDFNQANITLSSQDLVLRHRSQITTNAKGSANGGNITIDTGVLVALEDSDITANSANSRGGNVNITAQGIFGTKFRDAVTSMSDITASGKDSLLTGTVTINTLGVDPSRGLVTLPTTVIEPTALIAQNPCERGKSSSFVVTGRGGLLPNPSDALSNDATHVDLVEPASSPANSSSATTKKPPTRPTANRVEPAVGWVFNNKGEVVLTAYNNTGYQRPRENPGACHEP